jgi:hypothetical protein
MELYVKVLSLSLQPVLLPRCHLFYDSEVDINNIAVQTAHYNYISISLRQLLINWMSVLFVSTSTMDGQKLRKTQYHFLDSDVFHHKKLFFDLFRSTSAPKVSPSEPYTSNIWDYFLVGSIRWNLTLLIFRYSMAYLCSCLIRNK